MHSRSPARRLDQLEDCLAAGMDDYLSKPLSLPAIRAAVGRVLRARSEVLA